MPRINLMAKIGRNYGKLYVEFAASGESESEPLAVKRVYEELLELVNGEFDEYETNRLPKEQFDRGGHLGGSIPVQEYHALECVRTQKGKQVIYWLKTSEPEFAKHGVPLYERIKNYPKLQQAVDVGQGAYTFKTPLVVKVDKSGRFPKVIELVGAS